MLRNATNMVRKDPLRAARYKNITSAQKEDDSVTHLFRVTQKLVEKLPVACKVQASEKAARTFTAAHSRQLTVDMRRLPAALQRRATRGLFWILVS